MQNAGNIKFRNLVESLRPSYVATSSRKEKAKMISDMVKLIQSRKGRFLQRLDDEEAKEMGLNPDNSEGFEDQDYYVEMTDEEAAEKAKQAIRYVHYKKVPLEAARQKKRAANTGFLGGVNKANGETSRGIGIGGIPLASGPLPTLIQTQATAPNVLAGAAFTPQLQQPDVNQLLASIQNAPSALTGQLPGNDLNAIQAAVLRSQGNGVVPLLGQTQPPKPQLNVLLQSILQQQATLQQNSILQSILQAQQQQEQNQLNSALQTLQQQQLATAIQSLQQPQNQQVAQQQNTNAALASILSSSNGNSAFGAGVNQINAPGATNALLASMLSNNAASTAAPRQTGNLLPSLNAINGANVIQQQNPLLATNTNNSILGQTNTAKRQKISSVDGSS